MKTVPIDGTPRKPSVMFMRRSESGYNRSKICPSGRLGPSINGRSTRAWKLASWFPSGSAIGDQRSAEPAMSFTSVRKYPSSGAPPSVIA